MANAFIFLCLYWIMKWYQAQCRSCLSEHTLTSDICAAWGSAFAPWPRPESWGADGATGNPGSAPDGNTMTGSLPVSPVCPAGRWTASGSLQGSILQMKAGEERGKVREVRGEKLQKECFFRCCSLWLLPRVSACQRLFTFDESLVSDSLSSQHGFARASHAEDSDPARVLLEPVEFLPDPVNKLRSADKHHGPLWHATFTEHCLNC